MKKLIFIQILAATLLSSCGEFAYKRGAGANDFGQAKKVCESRYQQTQQIQQCLEADGWSVQKLDELDPFATITANADNRSITPSASTNANSSKNTSANSVSEAKNTQAISSSSAPSTRSPSANPPPADPLDKFIISSWWKIGGSADQLQVAINECVTQLGEAHRPNPITHEATRWLGVCMRDKGWRGLKTQKQ